MSNVTVTVERLQDKEPFETWVERSLRELRENAELDRLMVLDVGDAEVGGLPARRLLSHYLHSRYGGINLEQWLMERDGWGYVISFSVAASEYDDLADFLAYMAEGLRIEWEPS